MPPQHFTEPEIFDLLEQVFPQESFAVLPQVPDRTGRARRFADAVVMGLWRSRGLHLHGVEIKVSRSDWLRELKAPAKADLIACYCDFWWIVAPKGIVQKDELPETWGLLEADAGRLKKVVKAPKLSPDGMGRPFLAGLLRRLREVETPQARIDAAVKEALDAAEKREKARRRADSQDARAQLLALRQKVRDFEDTSGLSLDWRAVDGGNLGELVKAVLNGERPLKAAGQRAKQVARQMREDAERIEKLADLCLDDGKPPSLGP